MADDDTADERQATCATCRFLVVEVVHDELPTSECHRHPPQCVVIGDEFMRGWPGVDPDDWCGDYEPKPQPKREAAQGTPIGNKVGKRYA